jgi:hypothetical protein
LPAWTATPRREFLRYFIRYKHFHYTANGFNMSRVRWGSTKLVVAVGGRARGRMGGAMVAGMAMAIDFAVVVLAPVQVGTPKVGKGAFGMFVWGRPAPPQIGEISSTNCAAVRRGQLGEENLDTRTMVMMGVLTTPMPEEEGREDITLDARMLDLTLEMDQSQRIWRGSRTMGTTVLLLTPTPMPEEEGWKDLALYARMLGLTLETNQRQRLWWESAAARTCFACCAGRQGSPRAEPDLPAGRNTLERVAHLSIAGTKAPQTELEELTLNTIMYNDVMTDCAANTVEMRTSRGGTPMEGGA